MSRRAEIVILMLAFASIAVLGVFAMGHGSGGCLAQTLHGGVMCTSVNGFALAGFYLDALRGFSLATVGMWGMLVMTLLFSAGWVGLSHIAFHIVEREPLPLYLRSLRGNFLELPIRFTRWLKLHERRDPALML